MKNLKNILYGVSLVSFTGERERTVESVTSDSRKVMNNMLFVACKGLQVDGHDFVLQAITNGAKVVVYDGEVETIDPQVTYVKVIDSSKALGVIASNFYDNPSHHLKVIGITGTNGKTTCTTLLFDLYQQLGYRAGLISTVENRINDEIIATQYTTPSAVEINQLLHQMVVQRCEFCFIEVSSHALVQSRVDGIDFHGAVFTNISHDHLDYHENLNNYAKAKKILFDNLNKQAFALVNADDKRGQIMLQNTKAKKYKMALHTMGDFTVKILHNLPDGLELNVEGINTWFRLSGTFNAYNLLTVYAVASLLGTPNEDILQVLSALKAPKGRFEWIQNERGINALVDYAHTPNALENVLKTISDFTTGNELVIVVLGCGGERDREKRPKMAKIASEKGQKLILTTDNPRGEDPQQIIEDMKNGILKSKERNAMIIMDRKEAIKTACNIASKGDFILVAGKGHEVYQQIGKIKHPFDDAKILTEFLTTN